MAIALAFRYPKLVIRLILIAGNCYPTVRSDVLSSWQAIPLIGDIISHTVSPILARMMWPISMKKIFGPSRVPKKFAGFPKELALRPSQASRERGRIGAHDPGRLCYAQGLRCR